MRKQLPRQFTGHIIQDHENAAYTAPHVKIIKKWGQILKTEHLWPAET